MRRRNEFEAVEAFARRDIGPRHSDRGKEREQHRKPAGSGQDFTPQRLDGQRRQRREEPQHGQDAGRRGRPRQRCRDQDGERVGDARQRIAPKVVDARDVDDGHRRGLADNRLGSVVGFVAPRQSAPRLDAVAADDLGEAALVAVEAGAVGLAVPQVQHAGGEASVLAANAGTDQADENVGILAAPSGEGGVEAVDGLEVAAPERHVAAVARRATRVARRLRNGSERQREQRREPVEVAACAQRKMCERPERLRLGPCRARRGERLRRQTLRHQDAVAGDEPAGLGEPAMRGDEARPRDAIAVQEDEIASRAFADAEIADLGETEAAVLVPHMLDRDRRAGGPVGDDALGRRARAVVGDHDLETAVGLARQRAQDGVERVRPVIGRDDYRDQVIHGDASRAMPSCNGNKFLPRWPLPGETPPGRREIRGAARRRAGTTTGRGRSRS